MAILGVIGFAFRAEAAFDKQDLKCRQVLAKAFLKVVLIGDKVVASCHQTRDKAPGLLSVDCNDLGSGPPHPAGGADTRYKFQRAQQVLLDAEVKACSYLPTTTIADLFVSCPEPCNTTLGLPTPMATTMEAAQCLACLASDIVRAKNIASLDSPDPALLSSDDQSCRSAIATGYRKYLAAVLKARVSCQYYADKAGAMEVDELCRTSSNPDGKGKVQRTLGKAESLIASHCAAASLATLGSCATTNFADLKTCLKAAADAADAVAFPACYGLD